MEKNYAETVVSVGSRCKTAHFLSPFFLAGERTITKFASITFVTTTFSPESRPFVFMQTLPTWIAAIQITK